ncbi:prephenate dehydratase [Alkaliphilus crotonatoxidans]
MQVGYLGPIGSYSHGAVIEYWKDHKITAVAKDSFHELIEGIEGGDLEAAILPIENSTEGAVTQVMDLLLETRLTVIQGEKTLPVEHNLLGTGTMEQLKYVYSHPQALEQCRGYLKKQLPHVELCPCQSTSRACEMVSVRGAAHGAIAHRLAGELYQLTILKPSIQDNPLNQTRFIIVGRKEAVPTGRDKTSITFSFCDDYPGSLFLVLKKFAEAGINLTRIESRPAKLELGKYVFFIDFQGHHRDEAVKDTLRKISRLTSNLKIFGSYPQG